MITHKYYHNLYYRQYVVKGDDCEECINKYDKETKKHWITLYVDGKRISMTSEKAQTVLECLQEALKNG